MSRTRKTTAALTAAALIGGGGLGVAQAATTGTAGARPAPRHGGPLSSTQLGAIATRLGVSTAQLKAALEASKPARPADGANRGAGVASELAAALGADVAKVTAILDANRPAQRAADARGAGAPRPRPDSTKLVAALASGLNVDAATVRAAFATLEAARRAEHSAREAAMYAAVAARLDVGADAVQAAFEANRPAKPSS